MTQEECARICSEMTGAKRIRAKVIAREGGIINDAKRRTHWVCPPTSTEQDIAARLGSLVGAFEAHFQTSLTRGQPPEFLLYSEGDFFVGHRDVADGNELSRARRISAVLFLNDQQSEDCSFSGGDLVLYGLVDKPGWEKVGIPFPPKTGTLVAFRSDLWHEVKPITAGRRFTVVTWFE